MFQAKSLISDPIFQELAQIAEKYAKNERQVGKIWNLEVVHSHENFCKIWALFPKKTQRKMFLEATLLLRISIKVRTEFMF